MIRAGVTEPVAMSMSGHQSASIFRRYNITSVDDPRLGRRTKGGQFAGGVLRKCPPSQEHPVVVPQVTHLRQVPLRTMVNWPQSPQGSPS